MSKDIYFMPFNNEYYIRLLKSEDVEIVQNLCSRCTDYYEIVEDRPPEATAGHEILHDLPPGKEYKDKHVLGLFNKADMLLSVVDLVADYPDSGEWIIGLLMLDPSERGKGLGKELHSYIKEFAAKHGGSKLRIGVAEGNANAFGFWSKLGYYEIKRVNMKIGNKDNIVIVMNLQL